MTETTGYPSPPRTAGRRLNPDLSVLIVDSDATQRRQLKATLQTFGLIRIVEAADGSEALRLVLKHGCPDLVITELATHPLTGIQLLRILRRSPGVESAVPVIFLTRSNDRERVIEARDLQCSAWLLKPAAPQQLLEHIVKALLRADLRRRTEAEALRRLPQRPREPAIRLAQTPSRPPQAANVIDFASARARLQLER